MLAGKIFIRFLFFTFLTILTQIGGLVYLLNFLFYKYYKRLSKSLKIQIVKIWGFLFLYFTSTLIIVPILAKPFGRVPLPFIESNNIQPLNIMTCILNRHYVTKDLEQTVIEASKEIAEKYPNTVLNYLDANFPFIDKFPLMPHLSHNDGKKLDLSFCYKDSKSNKATNEAPSFIGYGICEEPNSNEENTAEFCSQKGNWQYSFMNKIMPQGNKKNFVFDCDKTKYIINQFCKQSSISKIFIEPHLKVRMGLTSEKVRFHGCNAVRHDDHIHIQTK
jgi:hypothetical protein